jgi:deazaflavin-dependent oxidoreductase (nitroreductase family)
MPTDKIETADLLLSLARQDYCYLTTKGRVSGRPHEIEIWFGANEDSIYLLSGGGNESDWVKNLIKEPIVEVRIAKQHFTGSARIATDRNEDLMARQLLATKYYRWREGRPLNDWARTALPVAIKLAVK